MKIRTACKRVLTLAAVGALAVSLTPAAHATSGSGFEGHFTGNGSMSRGEIRKHVQVNAKKYGSREFGVLALAFDKEFLAKAGAAQQEVFTRKCLDNEACASVLGHPSLPIKDDAVKKFHTAATNFCAKKVNSPTPEVTFKKYAFKETGTGFVSEKTGPTQSNTTGQDRSLELKNPETYTKNNTVGWGIEAKDVDKNDKVKKALPKTFTQSIGSNVEVTRTITAKPGENYRLDKGHQEVKGIASATFQSGTHRLCNNLKAEDNEFSYGHSTTEKVHQVDASGKILREITPTR
ncbi:hypothetical protein SAMN05421595_2511 [Austwickia chelonae]|uniref:Uncharacterized protein n=1 Tax=Austwickia chelonae NBRC 105200 TaxID=1184607 RepID=K6VAE1_9MICO|nr:hypothetical protein [Austwickia chelonae]GAB79203.1 hypothetical protein AUCHE_21_00290 [Austwickia chelonae NBRC 105200]SEW37185.1 hypothetical protein SAMN05421595_2511 [Austwickia chelonae]